MACVLDGKFSCAQAFQDFVAFLTIFLPEVVLVVLVEQSLLLNLHCVEGGRRDHVEAVYNRNTERTTELRELDATRTGHAKPI